MLLRLHSTRIIPNGNKIKFWSSRKVNDMYRINSNAQRVKSTTELGALLRKKRKAQGLTQAQVAEHCGISPRFISEVERGKASAEIGKVMYLLETLGVDLIVDTRD